MPDGESRRRESEIAVENPATGETIATVPELRRIRSRRMVAGARAAQPAWAAAGFDARAEVLLAARGWLVANAERVVEHDLRPRPGGPPTRPSSPSSPTGSRRSSSGQSRRPSTSPTRRSSRPRRSSAAASWRPLRAARRRRRDRPLELPAQQLVRRLHSGARGGQRRRAQALRGDAADLARAGRDARRVRPPRGRLPGRDRPRRDRRRAGRRGRLRHVHRLGRHRQEGDGAGGARR